MRKKNDDFFSEFDNFDRKFKRNAVGVFGAGCFMTILSVILWVVGIVGVVYGIVWVLKHFSVI